MAAGSPARLRQPAVTGVCVACRRNFVYTGGSEFRFSALSGLVAGRSLPIWTDAMNTSFFGELLQTISDQGKALVERTRGRRGAPVDRSESLVDLCEELVSVRGEASGTALARDILLRFAELTTGPRIAFFEALAHRFGPDRE